MWPNLISDCEHFSVLLQGAFYDHYSAQVLQATFHVIEIHGKEGLVGKYSTISIIPNNIIVEIYSKVQRHSHVVFSGHLSREFQVSPLYRLCVFSYCG